MFSEQSQQIQKREPNLKSKTNSHVAASSSLRKTHFGFREVTEDEKTSMVRDIFSSVAARYDLSLIHI